MPQWKSGQIIHLWWLCKMMHLHSQQWEIDNIGLHNMPDTLLMKKRLFCLRRAERHIYDEITLWTLSILTFQPNNQLAKVANVLWLGDALVAFVGDTFPSANDSIFLIRYQIVHDPSKKWPNHGRTYQHSLTKNKVILGKEIPTCQTWVIESEKIFQANKR